MGPSKATPDADLDVLIARTSDPVTEQLDGLRRRIARHVFHRSPIVIDTDPEIRAFAEAMAKSMAFADALGRIRMLRELRGQGEAVELEEPGIAAFAASGSDLPGFVGMELNEGIRIMLEGEPSLSPAIEDIQREYGSGPLFWVRRAGRAVRSLINSMTSKMTDHLSRIVQAGGEPTIDQFEQSIADAGFDSALSRTAFRTTVQTAYNHGRVDQARSPEMSDFIVGFEFQDAADSNVRPNHAAADGFRAPTDDPRWDLLTPPLGFNCRCLLRSITRVEAERKGWLGPDGQLIPHEPPRLDQAGPDSEGFGRRP